MSLFHQDAMHYLLTIMNMVSSLYKDPSIGNLVQVRIVRVLLLDDEEEIDIEGGDEIDEEDEVDANRLQVTHQAEKMLTNFCR